MSRVEELTAELKKAIAESDEYKEYTELNAIIEKYPDVKRAVDDYRRENFFFQYSDDAGDVMAATENLAKRFEDVKKQPYVESYLRAEMCLCRLVQEVCMELMNAVDFDVEFLHDEF
jgi:cell fate (sporulation/competence/biofilm development) regulator YlbF (YheA/YmcA/DUF963 family)